MLATAALFGIGVLLWWGVRNPGGNEPNRQGEDRMGAEHRAEVKRRYGKLFDEVAAALFQADPVGINFGSNADEYDPEAGTIIPRLRECQSAGDVRRVTHEEFVRWVGAETTGPELRYEKVAHQIWRLWQAHQEAAR